jgi:hypothetical protein
MTWFLVYGQFYEYQSLLRQFVQVVRVRVVWDIHGFLVTAAGVNDHRFHRLANHAKKIAHTAIGRASKKMMINSRMLGSSCAG